jgi:hypothetical protein
VLTPVQSADTQHSNAALRQKHDVPTVHTRVRQQGLRTATRLTEGSIWALLLRAPRSVGAVEVLLLPEPCTTRKW